LKELAWFEGSERGTVEAAPKLKVDKLLYRSPGLKEGGKVPDEAVLSERSKGETDGILNCEDKVAAVGRCRPDEVDEAGGKEEVESDDLH
jgi:hypothetical protein